MVGNHVFPGVSADPGYTAFWAVTLVTVPSGYVANQFRKAQDWASLNIMPTPVSPLTIVNCPIVGDVGAATPFSSGAVSASPSVAASSAAPTSAKASSAGFATFSTLVLSLSLFLF
ncbi:hypothetical protein BC830DRAFT_1124174 [Chytriomyces sp. MP71]|nr:hypothetical protein BC830DRAFT_1124174 [Chytriomyces sp. MP71]